MTDFVDRVLMAKISAEDRIRRQMRDYFVYTHDKYPEDSIEVETAITTFIEMEKNLIRQIEQYQNYIEEFLLAKPTPNILITGIDKGKDL